ncbi:MAG: hypothetical protein ABIC04_02640 [Nanoarchaeota archaeon]
MEKLVAAGFIQKETTLILFGSISEMVSNFILPEPDFLERVVVVAIERLPQFGGYMPWGAVAKFLHPTEPGRDIEYFASTRNFYEGKLIAASYLDQARTEGFTHIYADYFSMVEH